MKPGKRRNTKGIWFNEEEYAEIQSFAKRLSLYPRQALLMAIKKFEDK